MEWCRKFVRSNQQLLRNWDADATMLFPLFKVHGLVTVSPSFDLLQLEQLFPFRIHA